MFHFVLANQHKVEDKHQNEYVDNKATDSIHQVLSDSGDQSDQ